MISVIACLKRLHKNIPLKKLQKLLLMKKENSGMNVIINGDSCQSIIITIKNMKPFKNLSSLENEALLKFPAYIALLAVNRDDKLDEADKRSAIKFAHIKTFSCDPLLTEFYKEADKVFKSNIEQLDSDLPKEKESREAAIKKELLNLDMILLKLGKHYALTMHLSMKSFKEHVLKAHHNVLVDFLFPLPIPGLTDNIKKR